MFDFGNIALHEIVRSIEDYPSRPAFKIGSEVFTYCQFGERVSAIRKEVAEIKGDERIFALSLHDDINTYAAIVALWLEGLAYVPLHPNQPLSRNLNIVSQVGIHFIMDSVQESVYSSWGEEEGNKVVKTSILTFEEKMLDKWAEVGDDRLAYILFTSGSTGVPKGVMISRDNVAAFLDSFWKTGIKIDEADRCLQAFDLTFDVSVQSFLVALTKGACVYTVPYGMVKYLYVASLIQEEGITFGAMAPSMLTYLHPYFDEIDASSLKTCILTAEACPVDLMEDWYGCAVNTDIYDFYGPTEATVYCTYYKLTRGGVNLSENGIISIGKPLANVRSVILDEDGTVITDQRKGELCVAGRQITKGYWNNEEKNAKAFFMMERDGCKDRYYHTGDLCYRDNSGNIMYCGRIDQQVKIQGYRVELGEIEYHAREFYKKEFRVVAMAFQNATGLTEIALFIEKASGESEEMLNYLRDKLPNYMVPTKVIFKERFPLNDSDKINRTLLRSELNSVE